jgi:selenocysteine lyase/cysteine desulfurase
VWPLLELVTLCKQHNALVLVDAAHAPGQMALQVEKMAGAGMDFFLGQFQTTQRPL